MKALYSHTIQLIEPTKLLERNICDTMTVTNYLQREFTWLMNKLIPIWGGYASGNFEEIGEYRGSAQKGTSYTIYAPSNMFSTKNPALVASSTGCVVISPSGQTVANTGGWYTGNNVTITLSEEGTYQIKYALDYGTTFPETGTAIYNLGVSADKPNSTPWTITDVVNRILSAGETRRVSLAGGGTDIDKQKYFFDATQASDYSKKPAPEFFFTRGTLRGALDTVGAFIHGIPRLQGDYQTIKYLELGKENPFTGKLPAPIYVDEQIAGDEYANVLDSPAQNLLNTTDRASGAVVEPSADGWRALNSTGGEWLIAANTMTIITDTPIYQVEKLELKWGASGSTLDATAYLYEAAEYDVLSSYTGEAYPYSKGWALRYAQGGQEITGLNFVLDSELGGKDQNYAIVNILQALGVNVDNGADFANNLFYRVTYIPIAELRVTQKKPYLTHNGAGSLIYNQGGNTIESEYYGQKLKGVIARIGNKVKRRTYIIRRLKNLPQVGQTFYPDGVPERITNVDREFNTAYIKATVTSVPNFNRIAEYTGVNSNYRLYDISEKQSVDRFVHYEETCVISNSAVADFGEPMITGAGIDAYATLFDGSRTADADNSFKATAIQIESKAGRTIEDATNAADNDIIIKSSASFGFGNSLVFFSNMTDNYGAGKQSTSYEVNGQTKRASRQVQYGDGLGNISTMRVQLGIAISQQGNDNPFLYPSGEGNSGNIAANAVLFDTGDYPLFISKDSREAMHFTYQLHHQADDFNLIIGSGLCKYNTLVAAKQKVVKMIWLEDTLDPVNPTINDYVFYAHIPTGEVITQDGVARGFKLRMVYKDENENEQPIRNEDMYPYKSWALCTIRQEGNQIFPEEIIIGQNYPDGITYDTELSDIYFNFVDNAVLETLGMAE